MTAHDSFKEVLVRYYRAERHRSEDCLADIIKILECNVPESTQVNEVLERLCKHYDRS